MATGTDEQLIAAGTTEQDRVDSILLHVCFIPRRTLIEWNVPQVQFSVSGFLLWNPDCRMLRGCSAARIWDTVFDSCRPADSGVWGQLLAW